MDTFATLTPIKCGDLGKNTSANEPMTGESLATAKSTSIEA
jgi:hypothetical protein